MIVLIKKIVIIIMILLIKKDSDHNNDNINKKDNDHNNNINACNNNGKVSSKGKKRIIETDMYGLPKEKLNIKKTNKQKYKIKIWLL